uniref:F-box domain-containing protein n=1 Tax=Oryza brachyantha TaxID=4533 RepID=J3M8D0_ORYBR
MENDAIETTRRQTVASGCFCCCHLREPFGEAEEEEEQQQLGIFCCEARIHADPLLEVDQFDRLPDSLVLVILNNVEDVRSLGRCSAVSKRFYGLVPLVHDVYVKIDRVVTVDGDAEDMLNLSAPKPRNILSHFLKMMLFTIIKPFHGMRGPNGAGRPLFPQLAQHSPAQVLHNFTHIRSLRIELPSGDVGTEDGVLLKWRAEYGSTLQNCVILGGTQVDRKPVGAEHELYSEDNGSMPESFYTNGGLKLRVVWTISSLIAASTRHYLLRSIIKDHPTLTSLVLTDADGQGTLSMGAEQLKEFRENQLSASACSNRTQVPACNMKLKYAPYLELPGGIALQGATLVAIKPSTSNGTHTSRKESDAFISGAFDGPFKFAVKALMKRRTYLLEMNGF